MKSSLWETLSRSVWKREHYQDSTAAKARSNLTRRAQRKAARQKVQTARSLAENIEFTLPEKAINELFPEADAMEVTMFPSLIRQHEWGMPEHELIILGVIVRCLRPGFILEFGTFQGGSTLAMAANQVSQGKLVTVDIDPKQRPSHEHGLGFGLLDFEVGHLFKSTRFADQIEQRFVDSTRFSDSSLEKQVDLVFVDADHTYEYVKRDTATACRFLRQGGSIVWHDYTWESQHSECAGVTKAVNEFFEVNGHCHRIQGTRFAIYRNPM